LTFQTRFMIAFELFAPFDIFALSSMLVEKHIWNIK